MNILIVEDDLISRTVLSKLLSKYGNTNVAVNGREAIHAVGMALANNDLYNLICMDIIMPEVNGHEALVKIREMERKAGCSGTERSKIIMTTALGGSEDILESFRDECDGYLVKPFKPKDLTKLLDVLGVMPEKVNGESPPNYHPNSAYRNQ